MKFLRGYGIGEIPDAIEEKFSWGRFKSCQGKCLIIYRGCLIFHSILIFLRPFTPRFRAEVIKCGFKDYGKL